jgi:hypothetical protein
MFMASARPNPLDSNRPRPVRESRAQDWDTPGQRLLFIVLFKTLLGIALAHPTLTRDARDHLAGLIRGLIDRLEQRNAPAATPAQTSRHPAGTAIRARTGRTPTRIPSRRRRPRAEPAPPPHPQAPHCASANQVRGPPRHPRRRQHPALAPPVIAL